jgi:HEPN domain-containing protein
MPHDPASIDEANAWLRKAAMDLRAAEVDLSATPPLVEDAAFHAQQAAEKSLKAMLALHDRTIKKTHDLVAIGMECAEIDGGLTPLLRRVGTLTMYAWLFRYPGEPEYLSTEQAEEAFELAGEVFEQVSMLVSRDTGTD